MDTQKRLMGMSTSEWASYLTEELGVGLPAHQVATLVIDAVGRRYGDHPPLVDGAVDAVHRMASRWPLGLASSSPRALIEIVLGRSGLAPVFRVVRSTEEVPRGKPAPDVYVEVASRLGIDPGRCVAVEDSANGLRAAAAAGMRVIAIPHLRYPPDQEALTAASAVLTSLRALTPATVEQL